MQKHFSRPHTLLNKITTFVLMFTLSVGTRKGRTAINTVIKRARQANKAISIGFKVFLYFTIFCLLFLLKKWLLG